MKVEKMHNFFCLSLLYFFKCSKNRKILFSLKKLTVLDEKIVHKMLFLFDTMTGQYKKFSRVPLVPRKERSIKNQVCRSAYLRLWKSVLTRQSTKSPKYWKLLQFSAIVFKFQFSPFNFKNLKHCLHRVVMNQVGSMSTNKIVVKLSTKTVFFEVHWSTSITIFQTSKVLSSHDKKTSNK